MSPTVEESAPTTEASALAATRTMVGLAVALATTVLLATSDITSMRGLAVCLVTTWAGLLTALWSPTRGLLEARSTYLIVFGLFHGGLVVATALVGSAAFLNPFDTDWITGRNLAPAVTLVCASMIAFVAGVAVAPRVRLPVRAADGAPLDRRLAVAGAGFVVVGAALLAPALLGAGASLFSLSYAELFTVAGGRGFAYGLGFLTTGCGLMIAANGRSRFYGWLAMVAVAVVLLPIGLRGPVMFSVAPLVVVEARRRHFRLAVLVPAAVVVLALSSVLRQTRAGGLRALLDPTGVALGPLQGLAELGYSIRPVVEVRSWLAGGIPPEHGVTLVAPFLRTVERLTGTLPSGSNQDVRLFSVEMLQRAGPIGGSPVAEGLRNGGVPFALAMMLVIGIVVGALDRLPDTTLGSAVIVMVLAPLMADVRNDFAPVPARWLIAAGVLAVVVLWPSPDPGRRRSDA